MEKMDLFRKTCKHNVNKYIRLGPTISFQFMNAILNVPIRKILNEVFEKKNPW